MEKLLSSGCFVGIATHDERLVFQSLKLIDKLGLSKGAYEFQMLFGVEEELRQILLDSGHPVRVYLPFGREWFAYSVRRIKENPKMVGYVLANAENLMTDIFKKKKQKKTMGIKRTGLEDFFPAGSFMILGARF